MASSIIQATAYTSENAPATVPLQTPPRQVGDFLQIVVSAANGVTVGGGFTKVLDVPPLTLWQKTAETASTGGSTFTVGFPSGGPVRAVMQSQHVEGTTTVTPVPTPETLAMLLGSVASDNAVTVGAAVSSAASFTDVTVQASEDNTTIYSLGPTGGQQTIPNLVNGKAYTFTVTGVDA